MMKLSQLLEQIEYTCVQGGLDKEIKSVVYDSRKVTPDSLFLCIKGAVSDGHKYAKEVVEKGATVLVVQDEVEVPEEVTVIRVENTRYAMACISAAWFGHPAEKMKVIGITGTKGKTTTTYLVKSILENAGYKVGLIGTIEAIIGDEVIPAANTTPESYIVQEYFAKMVEEGCEAVVMEVSSQGLMLDRVAGFTFDYGVFTNLSADHIGPNEHKDFDDYVNCKAKLFKNCKCGIFNIDDEYAGRMIENCICDVETYGVASMQGNADLEAADIHLFKKPGILGVAYNLSGKINMKVEIDVPGKFSVYNSLAAIAICRHFTEDTDKIEKALEGIRVRGRVEILPVSDDFTVMVDYAHNAMSLESLLNSLKEYQPERIITVFGCGGNRDRNRRFEMGEVSSRLSDLSVITSDNPRDEEPMAIIEDILTGIRKADGAYVTIPDRKEAVRYALSHAGKGDIVVIAGKGHEDYQIIKGVKYHMDDRELVEEARKEIAL